MGKESNDNAANVVAVDTKDKDVKSVVVRNATLESECPVPLGRLVYSDWNNGSRECGRTNDIPTLSYIICAL
jgi:hypothetical protein